MASGSSRQTIGTLWQRGLPRLQERLEELDQAATAALRGGLPPELRERAISTAHKLAGSLGMFGYPSGTDTARRIELLLEHTDEIDGIKLHELILTLRHTLEL